MIFDWQQENWSRLWRQADRMPHALLLTGPKGGGKGTFADALVARLLCETAEDANQACGVCPSCKWIAAGNHPDFRRIEPDNREDPSDETGEVERVPARKKSDQIRIDQIRELDDFLGVGAHRKGERVILVLPAEAMNAATANSLLKVLEEPNTSTYFILVSNNRKRLLPTILSRCRMVHFPKPDQNQALGWLRASGLKEASDLLPHAGGMPLLAKAEAATYETLESFCQDLLQVGHTGPVAVVGKWEGWLKEKNGPEPGIDKQTLVIWLQKWVFDLLSFRLTGHVLYHPHKLKEIQALVAKSSIVALFDCYNDLLRIRAVAQHPLNPRLFFEDMLSRYAKTLKAVS